MVKMEESVLLEVRGFKRLIEDVQAHTIQISKRLNGMTTSSGCSGELCECFSSNKKIQDQTELLNRRVAELDSKLAQTEQNVSKHDKRIHTLERHVKNLLKQNDEMRTHMQGISAQIERGKNNSGRDESEQTSPKEIESKAKDTCSNVTCGNRRANISPFANNVPNDESVSKKHESFVKDNTSKVDEEAKGNAITNAQASNIPTSRPNFVTSSLKDTVQENNQSKECVLRSGASMVRAHEPGSIDTHEVVNQPNKEHYRSEEVWEVEAKAEVIEARKTPILELIGAKTVLLVDTSSSMLNGDGWKQAQTFVHDYIAGLEEIGSKVGNHEHVALVTFGAQTNCQQRFTNDMQLIKSTFDKLVLGGPSPLFGGLFMAHAAAATPEEDTFELENGMVVCTKIILITDGEPTETTLHTGPDVAETRQIDETKAQLIDALEQIQQHYNIFCVPVGNANTEFFNLAFSSEGSRRMLSYRDGHYFSKRLYLSMKVKQCFNFFNGQTFGPPNDDRDLSATDLAHIYEIIDDARKKRAEANQKREENPYLETKNTRLLQVGTRVRRGPDWASGDQDGNGPGTVVGHHHLMDRIFVHWDANNKIRLYDYGCMNRYCVFPEDEPRILLPGQPIDVGCVVCPGKDCDSELKTSHSKGVVIRMALMKDRTRKAVVRWENGESGAYSCGYDRKYEIQIRLSDLSGEQSYQSLPVVGGSDRTSGSTTQFRTLTSVRRIARHRTPAIEGPSLGYRPPITGRPHEATRPQANNSPHEPKANKNKNAH